ncbi:deoxyribodipyrimidine photo-lyase, partial [Klebsiella pneumoniae]|uniref:deoxyribodipyrimidine photo-lyase n=1 Tax=Klebsiella pneumoniae TaxID=573 RepID=UPI00272EED53
MLSQLCRELSVESVHVNEEYGIHESRRDVAVSKALEADGVSFHSYLDQLFFQPGSVLTKTGTYFQVFSQFRKVCYT